MTKYRGIVTDRYGKHADRFTRYHATYEAAHKAAERLAKKYYLDFRAAIDVVAVDKED